MLNSAGVTAAALCMLSAAPLCADLFTINTNGDTYISSVSSGVNFGNATSLLVDSKDSTLLNFSLSSLPAGLTAGPSHQCNSLGLGDGKHLQRVWRNGLLHAHVGLDGTARNL
jgi:hypothetical protein